MALRSERNAERTQTSSSLCLSVAPRLCWNEMALWIINFGKSFIDDGNRATGAVAPGRSALKVIALWGGTVSSIASNLRIFQRVTGSSDTDHVRRWSLHQSWHNIISVKLAGPSLSNQWRIRKNLSLEKWPHTFQTHGINRISN